MDLAVHPDNPIPAGTIAGTVRTSDSREIRYARFPANTSPLRGTVTILQGRAEFIEKYFETVEDLRGRGFAVVAFDWRGQGGSQRLLRNARRGYVDSFDEYVRDLVAVMEQVSLPDCPAPHFALTHSTGGLVALVGHRRLRTLFERALLASPLIGLGSMWPARRFIPPLAGALTAIGLAELPVGQSGTRSVENRFAKSRLTSDRRRFERAEAVLTTNPGLDTGPATLGWLNAACQAMKHVRTYDFAPTVSLPMLIVAAGGDEVVDSSASEELAARMRAVGYVEIPGARHELMMEADRFREQFWAAFDAFIPGTP